MNQAGHGQTETSEEHTIATETQAAQQHKPKTRKMFETCLRGRFDLLDLHFPLPLRNLPRMR